MVYAIFFGVYHEHHDVNLLRHSYTFLNISKLSRVNILTPFSPYRRM
nr:MAG TPA: hypothetical protein [Caudoviricetes sp.]